MLRHDQREKLIWESSLSPNEKLIFLAINQSMSLEQVSKSTGYTTTQVRNILSRFSNAMFLHDLGLSLANGGTIEQ